MGQVGMLSWFSLHYLFPHLVRRGPFFGRSWISFSPRIRPAAAPKAMTCCKRFDSRGTPEASTNSLSVPYLALLGLKIYHQDLIWYEQRVWMRTLSWTSRYPFAKVPAKKSETGAKLQRSSEACLVVNCPRISECDLLHTYSAIVQRWTLILGIKMHQERYILSGSGHSCNVCFLLTVQFSLVILQGLDGVMLHVPKLWRPKDLLSNYWH